MRLIDADALRAKYQAILDRGDMFCEYDIIGMLDNAPTVDTTFREVVAYECGQKSVDRPTGKWIEDYRDGTEYPAFLRQGWRCSVCNSRQTYGTPQYCMRCGAKMEAES